MANPVQVLALVTTMVLALCGSARTQSVDNMSLQDLKASALKMQNRIDQLEAAQERTAPARRQAAKPAHPPAPAAQGTGFGSQRSSDAFEAPGRRGARTAKRGGGATLDRWPGFRSRTPADGQGLKSVATAAGAQVSTSAAKFASLARASA